MNLILWRHAEAEDGSPDLARALTDLGQRQATRTAGWLRGRLPDRFTFLVSPATRTRQTADALGLPYEIAEAIAPGAGVDAVLQAVGWPDGPMAGHDPTDARTVLLVGHQPTLGRVAHRLLTGVDGDLHVRRSAIVWLSAHAHAAQRGPAVLQASISPELA